MNKLKNLECKKKNNEIYEKEIIDYLIVKFK